MLHLGGNPLIRTIRIRPPSPECDACGPNATIKVDTYDYDEFCDGPAGIADTEGATLGGPGERINVQVSSARRVVQMRADY
jgi:adenylyltransferase/sulfurtransferase